MCYTQFVLSIQAPTDGMHSADDRTIGLKRNESDLASVGKVSTDAKASGHCSRESGAQLLVGTWGLVCGL